jgi:hypothetical protein
MGTSNMICSNCSVDLPEGAAFCHKCGVNVIPPTKATIPPETPPGQNLDTDNMSKSVSVRAFTKMGREAELRKIRKKVEGRGWTFVKYQDAWLEGKAYFQMPLYEFNRRLKRRNWLIGITVIVLVLLPLPILILLETISSDNYSKRGPQSDRQVLPPDRQVLPRPSQGDYVVKDFTIGCISQQAFDEMTKYLVLKDNSALAQMIMVGNCATLEEGTPLFAEGLGSFGVSIVRPVGQRRRLYVDMDSIESIR